MYSCDGQFVGTLPMVTPRLESERDRNECYLLTPDKMTGRKLGDVKAVAEKLDCSPRHVYRLADAGRMPSPLRLASLVRWDLEEIDRWIADGCPPVRQVKGGSR